VHFHFLGPIRDRETIAVGLGIRELKRLRKRYGDGRWRKRKGTALVQLLDEKSERPRYIGTRPPASVNRDSSPVALELRKLYEVVPDEPAHGSGFIRVVDETGDDYLFPRECFAPVGLSPETRAALRAPT
jgi:hypothetical protein